jgi:hypothetical protein
MQATLDYIDAVAEYFAEAGEDHTRRGDLSRGLNFTHVAATVLCKQNRLLASSRVESNLRAIARALPNSSQVSPERLSRPAASETCLHVLREALPAGGLTAMAMRWVRMDHDRHRVHNAVLLSQTSPIPSAFREAIEATGGCVYQANPDDTLLNHAVWLRKLARESATYVILHVHNADVVAAAAFGVPGGPRVLFVNHSAHAFWVGVSTADLVLNVRGSAQEIEWTRKRGAGRYATLPIPLVQPDSGQLEGAADFESKRLAKKNLGLPEDAVVLLTAGASFKYSPVGELDFVRAAENILREVPGAVVLAAGVAADERWRSACRRTDGRILALGAVSQAQLKNIHDATDIYIEGFPIGTPTALLEAGLKKIPAVLAPAQCPPPYGSDGVAVDEILERPGTIRAYESEVVRLCTDREARGKLGEQLGAAIARHHSGAGWRGYLAAALQALPPQHSPAEAIDPVPTPPDLYEYWARTAEYRRSRYSDALETALLRALRMGLTPRVTPDLWRTCANARGVRVQGTIPLPLLAFLCNGVLPFVPTRLAQNTFRFVAFLCREALLQRVRSRFARMLRRSGDRRTGYEDYRWIPESPEAKSNEDFAAIRQRVQAARCHVA